MRYDYFVHRALRDFYFQPLLKTEWIGLAGRNYDKGFENSAQLFCTLSQEEQDNIPKALQDLYQRLKWTYTHEMYKRERKLAVYHMMWGRIYLAVCFYMYNEEFWVKTVIPLMEQMEPDKLVRQDMIYLKRLTAETKYPKSLLAEECRKIPAPIQQPKSRYNFQTRQLYPYSDQWENGMKGELWYVWEDDAICIIDGEQKNPIAKGFAAALLANRDELVSFNFNYPEFYKAYNCKLENDHRPDRYPFEEAGRMLKDWFFTLTQLEPIKHDFSNHLDHYERMHVGLILRKYFTPCKLLDIKAKLQWHGSMAYQTEDGKQWLLFVTQPNVRELHAAPTAWLKPLEQPIEQSQMQVQGFAAAIINNAIYNYWQEKWRGLNFSDPQLVKQFFIAWEKRDIMFEPENIENLDFLVFLSKNELFQTYMDLYAQTARQVWENSPTIPQECSEDDKWYSYLYACECQAREDFLQTDLYKHLTTIQKQTVYGYMTRFIDFLVKNYHITTKAQHEIMQALGRDLPPVQLTINTQTTITRQKEYCKKLSTFLIPNVEPDVDDDDIQTHLEEAAAGGATDLANYLSSSEGRLHFDFRNMSRPQVLAILNEECGTEIKEDTFYRACQKCDLYFSNRPTRYH